MEKLSIHNFLTIRSAEIDVRRFNIFIGPQASLLTALNNCIIAHSTYESVDQAGKQKVLEIIPQHQHIAFADVAAWTVTEKGTIKSILDEDAQIIGASILDGVSQHFETVTNELLDILYEGQSL